MSPLEPRRVLIATYSATSRSGSDLYTRDLALSLLRHGCQPVVYASHLGAIAQELRAATIPVTSDIANIAAVPDVIHGHHHIETLAALARFPGVPALFVCHDGITWHSTPPRTPRIGAYVGVDRNCRDRLIMEHGIPESMTRVLRNAVDLQRFRRRGALPPKPQRAAVFSNQASSNTFADVIKDVCSQRGIALDVIGIGAGTASDHPEDVLSQYDLVFGKARCALEAAATGAAVIVCDAAGLSGMVTTRDLDAMRQLNFGMRLLQRPINEQTIAAEIDRYDPIDAARVTDAVRATAGIDLLTEQFIELYSELSRTMIPVSLNDELIATAESLSYLASHPQLVAHQPQQAVEQPPPSAHSPTNPIVRSSLFRRLKKRTRRL